MPADISTGLPSELSTPAAFEALFRSNYGPLCSYASHFLADPDAAEEAVQEVLVKVWMGRASLTITTSIESYLFRATRNSCLNIIKHRKVQTGHAVYMAGAEPEESDPADMALLATELQGKIREAIERLPLGRRKVFVMSRYDGLTYAQIAEKLEISVKTVENQMGHALAALRDDLRDYLPLIVLLAMDVLRN